MEKFEEEKNLQMEDLNTQSEEIKTEQTEAGAVEAQPEEKATTTANISELEKVQGEMSELKDKYLRLYSEFENFRRRTAKERLDLVRTANEDLMLSIIPVIDDFERAQKAMSGALDLESLKEGISLVYSKFIKVLEQKNLKAMEVEKGSEFDTEKHEAITQIPAPEESLKGKVVDVVEKGYYLGNKVIRFAKVVTGA